MIPCSRILHKQLVVYFADVQPDGRDVAVLTTFSPPPQRKCPGSAKVLGKFTFEVPSDSFGTYFPDFQRKTKVPKCLTSTKFKQQLLLFHMGKKKIALLQPTELSDL